MLHNLVFQVCINAVWSKCKYKSQYIRKSDRLFIKKKQTHFPKFPNASFTILFLYYATKLIPKCQEF